MPGPHGSVKRVMSHGSRILVAFVVALAVIAACGISLVDAAEIGTKACGPATGWGPAKTDAGSSGLLLDLAPAPVGIAASTAPLPVWAGFPGLVDRVADQVPAEPVAPRAPPLA